MIYLTGDTHGNFKRILEFCNENNTTKNDVLVILGDVGINNNSKYDRNIKLFISNLPITLFCIHGNHENRASNISSYNQIDMFDSKVLVEKEFDNIRFAIDGNVYNINDNKCLVMGGAYSVDKDYRILNNLPWYRDEQMNKKVMDYVYKLTDLEKIDIIFSHTCPFKYLPIEWFISGINQSTVDNTMEIFFDDIYDKVKNNLKKWYCGHYHGSKKVDKIQFMFEDYDILN